MKSKWFLYIVVLAFLLGSFQTVKAQAGLETIINFAEETNPKEIGGYLTMYPDGTFDDLNRDSWSNSIELFFEIEKCIVPKEGVRTTFFARWSDGWSWFRDENLWGKTCYRLQK